MGGDAASIEAQLPAVVDGAGIRPRQRRWHWAAECTARLGDSKQWLSRSRPLEAATTTAQTRDLGDLFEYKLQDRVTIRKNQSALVPILQARIDAEKVSVWNPSQSAVLRALWLDNTSELTLDGGSFNVLEGDAFAGEGLMDPIKPGEKRLLSYAADLGVLVDAKQKIGKPARHQSIHRARHDDAVHPGARRKHLHHPQSRHLATNRRDRASRAPGLEAHRRREAGGKLRFLSPLPPNRRSEENRNLAGERIPSSHEQLSVIERH